MQVGTEGKKVSIGSQGKGYAPDSAMELTWSRRGREGVFVPLPALDRGGPVAGNRPQAMLVCGGPTGKNAPSRRLLS